MKKNINTTKFTGKNVVSINLNNYVVPNPTLQLQQTTKWITNGIDNSYFQYVEDRYIGSPTNAAIIDAYTNYIYGEGLESNIDIDSIISKTDVRLAVKDLKKQGAFALQVIYSKDKKSIVKLYHTPIRTLALAKQEDITDDIQNYWYCFDWRLKTKFRPYMVPAFNFGDKSTPEIAYYKIPSDNPLFALNDYVSCMQYCELEEQLSNYYINHIKNNFSAGKVININQGIPESDEAQEEAERAILNKTSGTNNAGNTLISFNDNKENATTVENIEITDAYQQFQFISVEARDKILMAHKVTNPILFGIKDGSGFGNNAEEMITALKTTYRNQINPYRDIFLDGLKDILEPYYPSLEVRFNDFDELNPVVENTSGETTIAMKKKSKNINMESYTDYPLQAIENAKIALRYAEENGWGDCGTAVGKARANQLANKEPISEETIARMAAFERHRQNSDRELGDGCGRLMWLAWGGDEGIEWASRKLKEIRSVELKNWTSKPSSSNIKQILYNDETMDLVIQFRSGDIYTYPEVDFTEFGVIFAGAGICRTSGENRWGSWYVGKTPSVGAAVYNTLIKNNHPYKKGGSLKLPK
jgi:hypothetical protein